MRWSNPGNIKPCGHDAMMTHESFTCTKRSCPYPYNSNGTVWNKRDADDMEDWIENGQRTPEVNQKIRKYQIKGWKELLIQLLWTEHLR